MDRGEVDLGEHSRFREVGQLCRPSDGADGVVPVVVLLVAVEVQVAARDLPGLQEPLDLVEEVDVAHLSQVSLVAGSWWLRGWAVSAREEDLLGGVSRACSGEEAIQDVLGLGPDLNARGPEITFGVVLDVLLESVQKAVVLVDDIAQLVDRCRGSILSGRGARARPCRVSARALMPATRLPGQVDTRIAIGNTAGAARLLPIALRGPEVIHISFRGVRHNFRPTKTGGVWYVLLGDQGPLRVWWRGRRGKWPRTELQRGFPLLTFDFIWRQVLQAFATRRRL